MLYLKIYRSDIRLVLCLAYLFFNLIGILVAVQKNIYFICQLPCQYFGQHFVYVANDSDWSIIFKFCYVTFFQTFFFFCVTHTMYVCVCVPAWGCVCACVRMRVCMCKFCFVILIRPNKATYIQRICLPTNIECSDRANRYLIEVLRNTFSQKRVFVFLMNWN